MANDVFTLQHDTTGANLYALIRDDDGNVADVAVDNAFEAFADASLDDYDLAGTEQGTASRCYAFTFPSWISAGTYKVDIFEQAGGTPAVTDDLVGSGVIEWDGSAIVSQAAKLIAIAGDVENLDGAAMRGTDGANTTTPLDAAGVRAAVGLAAADLDTQLASIPTNPMLDTEDGSSFTAIPWNAAWDTEVESEVNDALVALHLDHLFAVDYDPASKPGTGTALLNELIESNAGVSRYTAAALAQAPGGEASVNVTVSATSVAATTLATSGKLTLRRDNDNSFQLTGLGSLAGRSKLWFCLKRRLTDTDAEAILLAEENDGVKYIEGAAAGSSAGVTITVDDESAGDVTIAIDDDVMTQLVARSNLLYQVKVDDTELLDQTDTDVRCDVIDAVIRSVT